MCGLYPKDKNWFLSLDELNRSISAFRHYISDNWFRKDYPPKNKFCGLYGGEPTLHPQFEKILGILYENEDLPFCIYTNGRTFQEEMKMVDLKLHTGREISEQTMKLKMVRTSKFKVLHQFHTHEKNVAYRIDFKNKDMTRQFVPCLCAPCDWNNSEMTKMDYVAQAKKVCYQWNNCESSIYKGKAYACHLAAAMDHMFNEGKNGWVLEEGKNPFRKTQEEIDEQLSNFCHRCGYNLNKGMKGFEDSVGTIQYMHKETLVTETNRSPHLDASKIEKLET